MNRKLISTVTPVYNEELNIPHLYERLTKVAGDLADRYEFEFVFTDNRSTDRSFELLRELAEKDQRVRAARFSRNFGYQNSIFTAYTLARGAATIQLDCDMQDPPELIPEFLQKWEEGFRVVRGIRRTRREGRLVTMFRRVFYRLIDFLSEDELPHDVGDFQLLDRTVIDQVTNSYDSSPYLRGSIASVGFRQTGIPYDRDARQHGISKFSLMDMIKLGTNGILNHSIVPLRIATFSGLAVWFVTMISGAGYVFAKVVLRKDWPAGFATSTLLMLISISLNALFLGIIGEYLGRIYHQVKKRPVTIIEQRLNLAEDDNEVV